MVLLQSQIRCCDELGRIKVRQADGLVA